MCRVLGSEHHDLCGRRENERAMDLEGTTVTDWCEGDPPIAFTAECDELEDGPG